jgi:hypothetical protein
MADNGAKAPTHASTNPMGNTKGTTPAPLSTGGISPAARAKLREINPDATKALRSALNRSPGHNGMARDRR